MPPSAPGRTTSADRSPTVPASRLAATASASATAPGPTPSRFVVGLDLGTTNSALAYVDTAESPWTIRTFPVPQLVAPGQIEARETVPSFHYQPATGEFPPSGTRLPWSSADPAYLVGVLARDQGTLAPGRLIHSAKSWLCHPGVDRTAELLPWQGADDVERLSPVTVSARILQHFREAWDAAHPLAPLAEQDFVLTLPASFDEIARELTVRAAQQAGLKRVVLIEEPQAAFYAWIAKHADSWESLVAPGQKILVCDIGGGTTDFTLIRVRRGANGLVQFHRVAVGDHLILGGDNLDLALAHHLEHEMTAGGRLEPRVWSVLVRSCRQLKETLLGPEPPETYSVVLPGSGSKLIGGGRQVTVPRATIAPLVLDGFFPLVPLTAEPQQARSGFQEFGLPFAPDPAVTKYLASFLRAHRFAGDEVHNRRAESDVRERSTDGMPDLITTEASGHAEFDPSTDPARPDLLLFNGGVFESTALRQRIIDQLQAWFSGPDRRWSVSVLENERLDLAVARGAAYYGMVRRGEGVRIAAGLARTYYLGVETPAVAAEASTSNAVAALCLCPAGLEPGQEVDLTQRQFALQLGQPIEFPLSVSSLRLTDKPGDLVIAEREQLTPLPPLRTVLKAIKGEPQGTVRVQLRARLTEIGTLDVWCYELNGLRRWKLLFDVRSTTQTDIAAQASVAAQQGIVEETLRDAANAVLTATFRPHGDDPTSIMKRLHEALGSDRLSWPTPLLRQLWETLLSVEASRKLSPAHEARWLNLIGFTLRPGYGYAVDDWRVAETWKLLNGKLVHAVANVRAEWWILWRRVAGGLTSGQQQSLAGPLVSLMRDWVKGATKPRGESPSVHELAEQCRLIGSLEWLAPGLKQTAGEALLTAASEHPHATVRTAALWAIGRLGARRPVYGPLNTVVPVETVRGWLLRLMDRPGTDEGEAFAVMQLARKTDDRYRDLDSTLREQVLRWMDRTQSPKTFRRLVREVGTLETEDQTLVFGEGLPPGLRIL